MGQWHPSGHTPEANINGVVVLRDIPVDVVEPAVADLDVDVALKYQFKELYEW